MRITHGGITADLFDRWSRPSMLLEIVPENADLIEPIRMTNHNRDLSFGGNTYYAVIGGTHSSIVTKGDASVDSFTLTGQDLGLNEPGGFDVDLLHAGLYDNAPFTLYAAQWSGPDAGYYILKAGWLGEARIQNGKWEVEFQSRARKLQNAIGETTSPFCRADLGDARCKVDLAPFSITGYAIDLAANRKSFVIVDDALGTVLNATGYFDAGKITFTAGANTGISFEVKNWTQETGTVETFLEVPFNFGGTVIDAFTMHRGCHKRVIDDCKTIFDNVNNFRGEPYLPGNDKLQQYARNGV